MTPHLRLPRRQPGTHAPPNSARPSRFVGRACVPAGVPRWAADGPTLRRLLHALRRP